MNNLEENLTSDLNLNILAKSIYHESVEMGFKSGDYVKLMNEILDMTVKGVEEKIETPKVKKMKNPNIKKLPIHTKNLIIRLYNSSIDKEIVSNWFKDSNNRLFLLSTTSKGNLGIDNFINDSKNMFATITLSDSTPIGMLALLNIDKSNSKAEMRKMIGEINERGKGFAKEATEIWLRYCTETLSLNKIYINTIETNIKNITLNRQLGFNVEGLLRKECKIEESYYDVLRMAYLKE